MTKQTPLDSFSTPPKCSRSRWRMADWLLIAIVLATAVYLLAPQQLPVSLYKLSLVALAAVAGYWLDRSLFPYARPDVFLALEHFDETDYDDAGNPHVAKPSSNTTSLECKPDDVLLRLMGMAMLRRAIIVAAAMLAMGLGA